jgi:hypothetical protein
MRPIVFLNIAWMRNYRGLGGARDTISGGGAYVQEHGYGHEIYNFRPYEGQMYGYVPVDGSIALERLGASPSDDSLAGVLAVWVAPHPEGGTCIVGWYDNATIYRDKQTPPEGSMREFGGESLGYRVRARVEDSTLLPVDARVFTIPRGRPGGMGQANIWYADQPELEQFRREVREYVNRRSLPARGEPALAPSLRRQPDPYRRQRVEQKAVALIAAHYEALGYTVDSVEADNLGWDLEARLGERLLRIEAKGLSGSILAAELTPNEYAAMREHPNSYRICVVTNALKQGARLWPFAFSAESGCWEDDEGNRLLIQVVESARVSLAHS